MNYLSLLTRKALQSIVIFFTFSVLVPLLIAQPEEPKSKKLAFAQINDGVSVTEEIDLNGHWKFKATDEQDWMEAIIPSTVHSDLLRMARIPDPFYRDNELKVQWVEKKEWEYRRTFRVDKNFLKHDKIILDCRGLDTITEIFINGTLLSKTINMFIQYEFDVKSFLQEGENEIHIIFRSILEWNKMMNASEPCVIWKNDKGNSFFARKVGSNFGWDWGLRLVTCGIWRSIRLIAYDSGRISDLLIRQDLTALGRAKLNVTGSIEQYQDGDFRLDIRVLKEGKIVSQNSQKIKNGKAVVNLNIRNPDLWWPNGWGEQPLYTIEAQLKDGKRLIHKVTKRIGLRTIEIVREPDASGETFGIKVNGKLIFCKGVNWVPLDILQDRLTVEHYKHMLKSCKDVHMNMIRLWGSGTYEPDIFYDYCDENGIMIWHDFMFAVGPFLPNESYLKNVEAEIENVVKRLRHHPSIALWCGNNESESNMARKGGWVESYETVTWEGYDKIFYEVIPQTASRFDPDRPYWPSSPHHPLDKESQERPEYESSSGDAHLWDVWHGGQPFSWYADNVQFRFVSEFGFQSLPAMETVRSFTSEEDRHFPSRILDQHNMAGRKNAHGIGNKRIASYLCDRYLLPAGFANWVYLSQVSNGDAMKIACEAYRRNFPNTTGALIWQLNDNWPTISGSTIDYFGRWKVAHYLARHFFQPILVSGQVVGTSVNIWGVSEIPAEKPIIFRWKLAGLNGEEVKTGSKEVRLPTNGSVILAELDFTAEVGENPDYLTYRKDSYENRSKYYLYYELADKDQVLSSNVSFFVPPKYLQLSEPEIKYTINQENGMWIISLTSRNFAAYLELGLKNGYALFSDNYFHLLPGEEKKIQVLQSEVSDNEFPENFYVKSLIDSYRVADN
jgi:beta-mannosidase